MLHLLSDTPERVDRLGFAPMADILTEVVRNTPPPFTVGVFGEWGSGKTTLMTLVRDRLEDQGVKTAWFNAWKYDGKEVVWNALIQSVFHRMRQDPEAQDAAFLERLKETALKLAAFAARRFAPIATGGAVDGRLIDGVADAVRPLTAEDPEFDFINSFEATFAKLVQDYVGPGGRMVVFVDDLDRCLPATAVEVLEAIKLYLDQANVTFVIGVEPEVVRTGIRHRYKDNAALAQKEYLEKIVQLPFMMRGLDKSAALRLIEPYRNYEALGFDDLIVEMVLRGTEANPRRIKRFINTYYVTVEMRRAADEPLSQEDLHRLALVLLIQMRFREVFDDLTGDPGLIAKHIEVGRLPMADRDNAIARSRALTRISESPEVAAFLDLVRDLDCSKAEMRRWVLLTAQD